ncbi:hypothetical protein ACFVIM_01455 [Streptomyces sp. NPDC057638]|uniref:hypothetical protein n=1 Tax=Streptomyces sp. NPDC057638 TaxID=3346190 RepID=UPI0036D00F7B
MELSATGEPVVTHEDTQVKVGLDLQAGTLILTRDGTDLVADHALVEFAAPGEDPWTAQQVRFLAHGPDGAPASLVVDLLNDACDGPRDGVPAVIWRWWLSPRRPPATSAITYVPPP